MVDVVDDGTGGGFDAVVGPVVDSVTGATAVVEADGRCVVPSLEVVLADGPADETDAEDDGPAEGAVVDDEGDDRDSNDDNDDSMAADGPVGSDTHADEGVIGRVSS